MQASPSLRRALCVCAVLVLVQLDARVAAQEEVVVQLLEEGGWECAGEEFEEEHPLADHLRVLAKAERARARAAFAESDADAEREPGVLSELELVVRCEGELGFERLGELFGIAARNGLHRLRLEIAPGRGEVLVERYALPVLLLDEERVRTEAPQRYLLIEFPGASSMLELVEWSGGGGEYVAGERESFHSIGAFGLALERARAASPERPILLELGLPTTWRLPRVSSFGYLLELLAEAGVEPLAPSLRGWLLAQRSDSPRAEERVFVEEPELLAPPIAEAVPVIPDRPTGLGDGPSGEPARRRDARRDTGRRERRLESGLTSALEWLVAHQSEDGRWDSDGFSQGRGCYCDGLGPDQHDVGVTGLALLALMGTGDTSVEGEHHEAIAKGVEWLLRQQAEETGLIGAPSSHEFLYSHCIATQALCEAFDGSRSPLLSRAAQRALDYIQLARNPEAGWRYDVPPSGESDTSMTAWAVAALTGGMRVGLVVDPVALQGALAWIDAMSRGTSGRIGYDSFGSQSSRTVANEHYPREKGQAMTAAGLMTRVMIASAQGRDIEDDEGLESYAQLLMRTPPEWDPEGFGCDMYYWYWGSQAMYQTGGRYWREWRGALEAVVRTSQRTDHHFAGSWDPVGPWGYAGGRVYSTALMALAIESGFRHERMLE